jgi:hypothetical protein
VDSPAPLAGSLLKRTHFSITGRAFAEVLVPRIRDRACPACEFDQYESRRTARSFRVGIRACQHDIDFVFWNEHQVARSSAALNRRLLAPIKRESTQVAEQSLAPFPQERSRRPRTDELSRTFLLLLLERHFLEKPDI